MGAVCGTRQPVHLGAGAAEPLTFVPVVEMLHLHLAAEAHEYSRAVWEAKEGQKFSLSNKLTKTRSPKTEEATG